MASTTKVVDNTMKSIDELTTEELQQPVLVAVYGSLLSGLGNHHCMNRAEGRLTGTAVMETPANMYSLGGFPFITYEVVDDPEIKVVVEIYEVPLLGLLGPLDRLEGYNVKKPKQSFYRRTLQPFTMQAIEDTEEVTTVEAWIYDVSDAKQCEPSEDRRVVHKNWRKFVEERQQNNY